MKSVLILAFFLLLGSCSNGVSRNANAVNNAPENSGISSSAPLPVYGFDIVKKYKHDRNAFTQGLLYRDGFLYESTGNYGNSSLRKVEYQTGKVLSKFDVANDYFAEGIALVGDEVYQLTWQSGLGFVYSLKDFKLLREFRYSGDGWGLTFDGTNLYHSDGTHIIRVIDPKSYQTVRTIAVNNEDGKPLMKLNELEWVKGEIWANIWHSEQIGKPNYIARIDPSSGKLIGWINLAGISPEDTASDSENTMNGIAYDADGDRIFVTGKNWKNLYEIQLKN